MSAVLVLVALLALTPAAYASPPDQTWVSGLYDNADFDDVILFIDDTFGAIAPSVVWSIRPMAVVVDLMALVDTASPIVSPLSSDLTRAPPLV